MSTSRLNEAQVAAAKADDDLQDGQALSARWCSGSRLPTSLRHFAYLQLDMAEMLARFTRAQDNEQASIKRSDLASQHPFKAS